mmetsp:Transcript_25526/g.37687  ORF Transcript_25526/g.37687 Transcript_25526/m.37687 type:complete len:453 (+) Transcript_25526:140-1498(+)|eukprot:CAMPEP_0185028422 /NCGR_PEP_ID=MMETSP1103-20130426/14103_1 /TAXON_ID=36769 /ORGANISM="Paraphysomonas bandaiensis, Strain Caron Lab Isolate" /LENGTH=452 /DNA_ID=CAMNT_0027562835 /DNA_START=54 /DNA_END=1412 /DNA_ORIENTATION=+
MEKFYYDHISLRYPGDDLQSHEPSTPCENEFKMYTMDLSYFSGKLEMYCRYKEIPYERIEVTGREMNEILARNSGTEQVPQLYDMRETTPESRRWLRDTTPIIEYLEKDPHISKRARSVIPSCPVQMFIQFLLEDFADEHLWRPAMFWRWDPDFDRFIMGHRFSYEFMRDVPWPYSLLPRWGRAGIMSLRQWLLSVYGEDCLTQSKKDVVKAQYLELLDILQSILSVQPYLFGNHPTLVDFGFAGPFFRHFSSDFTPRKVMQLRAPAVFEWMARLWNCRSSTLGDDTGFPSPGRLPDSWSPLLRLVSEYLRYSHLNAMAYQKGHKDFEWPNGGQVFRVPVVHYRVWCRMQLQKRFKSLDETSQREVEAILRRHECWEPLWAGGDVEVAPECDADPPFAVYPPPKKRSNIVTYKWNFEPIAGKYFTTLGMRCAIISLFAGSALWTLARSRKHM